MRQILNFRISIHPMLRFNIIITNPAACASGISIHPMLRFNAKEEKPVILLLEFQYILCYGSTLNRMYHLFVYSIISIHPMLRFNDDLNSWLDMHSEISIHPMLRFNIVKTDSFEFFVSISIHPMLRFNFDKFFFKFDYATFQYILCYGSTAKEEKPVILLLEFQYILCYGSTTKIIPHVIIN